MQGFCVKLLLSWILDHLDLSGEDISPNDLVEKFNTHTAEIEYTIPLDFSFDDFFMAFCLSEKGLFKLPDSRTIELTEDPLMCAGKYFLFRKFDREIRLAQYRDFGQDREGILPPFWLTESEFESGSWRACMPTKDVVLVIDNKSMTNRPDLWSARGIAREIGLLFNLALKPKADLILPLECKKFSTSDFSVDGLSFANNAPSGCLGFSLTKFLAIKNVESIPFFAFRLLAAGQKITNGLVDLTNYVMFDWGMPMHAFDADLVQSKKIEVRFAKKDELITLLGQTELSLTDQDLLVTCDQKPVALAGIKGGAEMSVLPTTTNLLLEIANWDPGFVRKTAQRHKIRTESCARYEKFLDTESIPDTARRFAKLAIASGLVSNQGPVIYFSAPIYEPTKIVVEHAFLEKLAGMKILEATVLDVLQKLEFLVSKNQAASGCEYLIEVPSNRATKNIKTKHDIFEEVIRSIGYDQVPLKIPVLSRPAYDLGSILKLRNLKSYLAYGANFIEQVNYNFFEESFVQKLEHPQNDSLEVINPVSENHKKLVTTLFYGLFKNIETNALQSDELRFFEVAKIWPKVQGVYSEQKVLAGIFASRYGKLNFYQAKETVDNLANVAFGKKFVWQKPKDEEPLWAHKYQLAELFHENKKIGVFGAVNPGLIQKIDLLPASSVFYFELQVSPLLEETFSLRKLKPLAKHQFGYFDVSIFVPASLSCDLVKHHLQHIDPLVSKISLLDLFEKKENNILKRSLAFRVFLQAKDRNIEKNDVDKVNLLAVQTLNDLGATVR